MLGPTVFIAFLLVNLATVFLVLVVDKIPLWVLIFTGIALVSMGLSLGKDFRNRHEELK